MSSRLIFGSDTVERGYQARVLRELCDQDKQWGRGAPSA
jgi:hypothetical protein